MNNKVLQFRNITKIKFTKIENNDKFSLLITGDVISGDKELNNYIFEASLCSVDSTFYLQKEEEEEEDFKDFFSKFIKPFKSVSYTIPLNIKLFTNTENIICSIMPQKNINAEGE